MVKDVDKMSKTIHFIEKWFIIALILFLIIQVGCISIINLVAPESMKIDKEEMDEYQKDYIGHWYDGTFFINMTVSENFESTEKYEKMLKKYDADIIHKVSFVGGTVFTGIGFILILIAAYRERKKKLLVGHTPVIISLSGLAFMFYKIFEEIDMSRDAYYYGKYSGGFLSTATYYPQIYNIFIIPCLLIALGLILRQKQRKDLKLSTKNNEKLLKVLIGCIITIGCIFIGYRFGVRTYEVVANVIGKYKTIRLPYYYFMLDLPFDFAKSSSAYTKLVILRYFKDLPVFISSTISIYLFSRILHSACENKILDKENKKRYKIIYLSLFISSIILNLVGLLEVSYFNHNFLYQYSEATYTIAIRSLSEPLLYAGFIFLFSYYVELTHKDVKKKK